MPTLENIGHRPSVLKQFNKKHKKLGHRTKGQVASLNKGRTNSQTSLRSIQHHVISREQRRNTSRQKLNKKNEETFIKKRSLGTISNAVAPFLVSVISLHEDVSEKQILSDLENQLNCISSWSSQGLLHLTHHILKCKYSFVAPPSEDQYAILDTVKASDTVLFIWKLGESINQKKLDMISSLNHQAMPSTVHVVVGDDDVSQKKKVRQLKELKITLKSLFPCAERVHSLKKDQDVLLLLRQISTQKRKNIAFRDRRTHIIAENVKFIGDDNTGTLVVEGFLRGKALNPESLMHIPGCENYQIESIHSLTDPFYGTKDSSVTPLETSVAFPDPERQESLQSVIEEDNLKEELPEEPLCTSSSDEDEEESTLPTKRFPKGTSNYQAAWLFSDEEESDSDASSSSEEELEPLEEEDGDQQSLEEIEMEDWETFKAEREESDDFYFADEMDTPMNARESFKDYQGLESFKTSPWDVYRNVPGEYSKIYHFPNFRHLSRKQLREEPSGVGCGTYVVIRLLNFPRHHYEERIKSSSPFLLFSLLKYEQKMTVVNILLKSVHNCAIRSEERLIFHAGFSRFENNPLFSEHTNGNKHKMARFLHPGQTVIGTMYAPAIHMPCPVSVYQTRLDGSQVLVAVGSVFSVDAKRVICERVVLSGHPYKINKKSAVVRFMFFNAEDVNFFKPIQLRTKWGNKGRIEEPIGTHGHMKCKFKGQLKSQDAVLLNLYRRVFPKWSYDSNVRKSFHCDKSEVPPIFDLFDKTTKKVRFR